MTRRRHAPKQIIRKLREAERLQAEGADIAEAKMVEIEINRRGDRHDLPTSACGRLDDLITTIVVDNKTV